MAGCGRVGCGDPVASRPVAVPALLALGEKTWTSERDIKRVLDELSDHLEVVISTCLRGQFATIDEYNRQAGEVAQPYRVLVVFDYPNAFSGRAARQLLSLIENGRAAASTRCCTTTGRRSRVMATTRCPSSGSSTAC